MSSELIKLILNMNEKILSLKPHLINKPKPKVNKTKSKLLTEAKKEPPEIINIPEQNLNSNTRELAFKLTHYFKLALNQTKKTSPKATVVLPPSPQPNIHIPNPQMMPKDKNQSIKELEKQEKLKKISRQRQEENNHKPKLIPAVPARQGPQPIYQPRSNPLMPKIQPRPRVHNHRQYELNDGLTKTLVNEFSSR